MPGDLSHAHWPKVSGSEDAYRPKNKRSRFICTADHGDRDDVAVFEPRARDGFERARRRPPRGHDAENATRVGGREGREGEPGSFHYFYNLMPSIDEIFGSL